MHIINIIKEEIENLNNNQIKQQITCLKNEINTYLNVTKFPNDITDPAWENWYELRIVMKNLEGFLEDGGFSMKTNEYDKFLSNFTNGLNINDREYTKGEEVLNTNASNSLNRIRIKLFNAIDNGNNTTLFRAVSLKDWDRIQKQGFIDSDMRGAVSEYEGINLTPDVRVAENYLPNSNVGVILAINPQGLNLFKISADNYVRTFDIIPIENVIKVSPIIKTSKLGSTISPNTEDHFKLIKNKLIDLGFKSNCLNY